MVVIHHSESLTSWAMAVPLDVEANSMHITHTPKANGPAHRNIQLYVIYKYLAKSVYGKIRNSSLAASSPPTSLSRAKIIWTAAFSVPQTNAPISSILTQTCVCACVSSESDCH